MAVVAEGGLAFLGLSVEKGPTWGKVILTGAGSRDSADRPVDRDHPDHRPCSSRCWRLNFAGDRIRSYFDAKETAL